MKVLRVLSTILTILAFWAIGLAVISFPIVLASVFNNPWWYLLYLVHALVILIMGLILEHAPETKY